MHKCLYACICKGDRDCAGDGGTEGDGDGDGDSDGEGGEDGYFEGVGAMAEPCRAVILVRQYNNKTRAVKYNRGRFTFVTK